MDNKYDIFINYKQKSLSLLHDSWFMVHESWITQAADSIAFGVPLVLLWFSYKINWICSAFEEGSGYMQRYTLLTNISALALEVDLVASQSYVQEVMNIDSVIR